MTGQAFRLVPFPAGPLPEITLTGNVERQGSILRLSYVLAGRIEQILLPSPSTHPGRRDELWMRTCFEFFLAIKEQPQYWEFNLSPSGDWNAYCMDAYRRVGFREETSMQRPQLEARQAADRFSLQAAVDLKPILPENAPLELGITAVMQALDGSQTYWALAHPAAQADFHLKESFICTL